MINCKLLGIDKPVGYRKGGETEIDEITALLIRPKYRLTRNKRVEIWE